MIYYLYKVIDNIVFNIIKSQFQNQITNVNIELPTLLIYNISVKITKR